MNDLMFAHPERLWGMSLIIVFLLKLAYDHRRRPTIFFSALAQARSAAGSGVGKWILHFKNALAVAILALLVILLARPQYAHFSSTSEVEGIDLFFALDISESMLAEDLTPNRLQAAKSYIRDFIDQLHQDRTGIMVFSGKPFVQVPLTFDYEVLKAYLDEISVQTINQRLELLQGTAVGDVMLEAKRRLPRDEENERERVLVLVTDGDSNVGLDPIIGARVARQEGIKIYTIGIGKKEGAPIPVGVKDGQKLYAKDHQGNLILTKFNQEVLEEIARIGRGKFFYAENNQALKESFEAIQELEKGRIRVEDQVTYTDRSFPFLLGLVGLVALYLLLEAFKPLRL